jgi:hypothetical protein
MKWRVKAGRWRRAFDGHRGHEHPGTAVDALQQNDRGPEKKTT